MLKNIIYGIGIIILIPMFVFLIGNGLNKEKTKDVLNVVNDINFINQDIKQENKNNVKVNTTNNKFENYIIGVLGAEMPISFHMEALKAQAVSARTYAYRRIDDVNEDIDYKNIGQAYYSIDDMKKRWGDKFDSYYSKIQKAVNDTKGIIMMYNGEPIEAVFHSTSGGKTEVSENIWGKKLPYIKSVDSSVDENAPNFISVKRIPNNEFINKISSKLKNINKKQIVDTFEIKERSNAGYVLKVATAGYIITGRELREMFSLRSTNFIVEKQKNNMVFTTKGYGHGAGMSQYGANFMAEEGDTYEKILKHYYSDIQFYSIY